ncbi:hypothetical protein BDV32DRAFT_47250 [Aspergillus pseudonomiae]|nr:hypothetical protein BDV32DRAFT_47250 [Aspergillus pseudonomiae]
MHVSFTRSRFEYRDVLPFFRMQLVSHAISWSSMKHIILSCAAGICLTAAFIDILSTATLMIDGETEASKTITSGSECWNIMCCIYADFMYH